MYIPPSFRIDDAAKLSSFMNSHSFATLVTCDEGLPVASHLPVRHFVVDDACQTLVSHMARANSQWKHFSRNTEVLTIFHGPHGYISPAWYSTDLAVPTWNYAVVHVYGHPRILEDHDRVVSMLEETIRFYERSFEKPWPGILPEEFRDQLIQQIVAFEIDVTRVEGKFKLGQNRSKEDLANVYDTLNQSNDFNTRQLAELMQTERLID